MSFRRKQLPVSRGGAGANSGKRANADPGEAAADALPVTLSYRKVF